MNGSRRVAAIDVGTNTVLLLVAEGTAAAPRAVVERAAITRLGAGVDRTGRLSPEAVARTVSCLESYATTIREQRVQSVDVVCTSAARDAANGSEFIDLAARALGVRPRIVDGEEEARLTFAGGLAGLPVEGEVTVFDIGGGSTEVIRGTREGAVERVASAVSLDIGSVRLTERHVTSDPPTDDELARIRSDVERALASLDKAKANTLVGVAGTITSLAAIHAGMSSYDSALVHGTRLEKSTIVNLERRLATMPLAERRALPGLEPARADVIVAGTIIAHRVLDWSGSDELLVSDRGVRWGLARKMLESFLRV
jgi:exopolyphosphatase/guanosine-5'-triphosphate,3'-diphosphate pyrophosphatase